MANTTTFYRKANTSRAEATASLYSRFPNADLVSFVKKAATADEAAAAGANKGEAIYAATIRMADFPPAEDSGDGGDSEPKEEKPEKAEGGDDGGGDAPDFGGGDEGGEEHEPLSGEDLTNSLLQKILDAVSGGADMGMGPGGPGGPEMGLPDVGAPGQGEMGGGMGGPKPPLPPPVRDKAGVGAGAFAHYDRRASEFSTIRAEANSIGNKALIDEAAGVYPTHRVARIQRTGSATINGKRYNLPKNGIAVVTLTAK